MADLLALPVLALVVLAVLRVVRWVARRRVARRSVSCNRELALREREKREGPLARWRSAHEELHRDAGVLAPRPTDCAPCLSCQHRCDEHEQLVTSHDQRFYCHVRGCPCTEYARVLVRGVRWPRRT